MAEFNLALVHETVSAAVPDRTALIRGDRAWTFKEISERSRRLASYLHRRGLGVHAERAALAGHESGQDHIGLYLYNGNEYLEGMLGAYRARVAPFNVNYRYVEEELRYLLADARTRGLIYHASFAPVLAAVLPALEGVEVLIQVDDGSGHDLLAGAVDYEEALASGAPEGPPVDPSPDDLYILYTGGTTGMPKGVLWRQHDIFLAAMGGRPIGRSEEVASYGEIAERAAARPEYRMLVLPPLMHGAAQWACFGGWAGGGTVVLARENRRLDPVDVWTTVQQHRVQVITVVGNAMARPLVEELERNDYDISSLIAIGNGGAALNPALKQRLVTRLPHLIVSDSVGSSETGAQMTHASTKDAVSTGTFRPGPGTTVVSENRDRVLEAGGEEIGWLAQSGNVPLGYLGDPDKTAETFPVTAGIRYSVPGDRATLLADGQIELLGRDSVTINSGGEKIFAEEVERALSQHPAVADVVVVGRPSDLWGQEVVALVTVAEAAVVTREELIEFAARHVARYKLPKAIAFLPDLHRSPAGKADYRWARDQAVKIPDAA